MGIQDRDYYREGPSFLDRVGAQGATVWLVAITCGVFFGQVLSGHALTRLGEYDPQRVLEGEVWRLITPVFLHRGLWHLFFNMFVLFWAGQRVEEVYGPREFVSFYLFAGLTANVLYLGAFLVGLCPVTHAVGASGAVVAVMVLFALNFPRARLLLFFVFPVPAWAAVLLFVALDLFGALGPQSDVAYLVHLGGALFALVYFQAGWRFGKLLAPARAARVRPKLRIVPPPPVEREPEPVPVHSAARPAEAADEQLEAKLDAILEKVSKHGQGSLTAEERELLVRASQLFKSRRK